MQPALPEKRRTLFFFVGDTRPENPKYSHGVRQAVLLLNNTPGDMARLQLHKVLSDP